jgi:hypothetical protein
MFTLFTIATAAKLLRASRKNEWIKTPTGARLHIGSRFTVTRPAKIVGACIGLALGAYLFSRKVVR